MKNNMRMFMDMYRVKMEHQYNTNISDMFTKQIIKYLNSVMNMKQ